MWSILLFYFVVTMFVRLKCSVEFCVFQDMAQEYAVCGKRDLNYTLDFIPPVSNYILSIDMYGQPLKQLPNNAFRNLSSVRNISQVLLLFCQIQHIASDAFLDLENVTELSLSFNDIRDLASKPFQNVKHVKYIYMARNHIEELRLGLFADLPLLIGVHLAYNKIRYIEKNTFQNTPSLEYLVLSDNQLEHLDLSFMDKPTNSTSLYLYGNPWICDCNLLELYTYYTAQPQATIGENMEPWHIPRCAFPGAIHGRYWKEEFMCNPRIIMPSNQDRWTSDGSNITLSCVVHGYPMPEIKWRKGATVMAAEQMTDSSYPWIHYVNYTFTAHKHDAGEYVCIVKNGQRTQQANLTLYIYHPWWIITSISFAIGLFAIIVICIVRRIKKKKNLQFQPLVQFNRGNRNGEEQVSFLQSPQVI